MANDKKGKGKTLSFAFDYISMILYFDTETSGLHPGQICQLSYILQSGNEVTPKNIFFTVDYVEYGALSVHGFSVEKLKSLSNGKRFSDCFYEIEKDFKNADLIVSHNTSFDFSFMRAEYERLDKPFIYKDSFCTMKKTTSLCKLKRSCGVAYKYPKLSELCAFLGISDKEILTTCSRLFGANVGYHDARFDTTAVYLAVNKGARNYVEFDCLKDFL